VNLNMIVYRNLTGNAIYNCGRKSHIDDDC